MTNKKDTRIIDQQNNVKEYQDKARVDSIVTIKLQDLINEEIPAKCKENTLYSIFGERVLRGGYNVHPAQAIDKSNKNKDRGNNHKERAFIRGNSRSDRLQ